MKKEQVYRNRRRSVVAGTALAITGVAAVLHGSSNSGEPLDERVAAVKSIHYVLGEKVVLDSGVHFHFTPTLEEGGPEESDSPGPNNVDNGVVIHSGEKLVIYNPMQTNNANWIGMIAPNKHPHTLKERAEDTVWVDITDVQEQGYATGASTDTAVSTAYPVEIAGSGNIVLEAPNMNPPLDLAQAGEVTVVKA